MRLPLRWYVLMYLDVRRPSIHSIPIIQFAHCQDVVVYFRISNATISVTNVEDSSRSTKLLAQTTLRNILGTKTLAEMLRFLLCVCDD